jgi:hypothetical protein
MEEKIEEFYTACEERQRMLSNKGESANAQQAAHPPVVYFRNVLHNLQTQNGGQVIYDSLIGGPSVAQS